MDKYKLMVWGVNEETFNKTQDTLHSIESAIVFFENGSSIIVDFASYNELESFYFKMLPDDIKVDMLTTAKTDILYKDLKLMSEAKYTFSEEAKLGFLAGKALSDEDRRKALKKIGVVKEMSIPEPIFADPELDTMETVIEESEKENTLKKDDTLKKVAIGTAAGLVAGGVIAAGANLAGCGDKTNDQPEIAPIESEQAVESQEENVLPEVPSMEGQDFDYYTANDLENVQKLLNLNIDDFSERVNAGEDWAKVTLDSDKAKELGYEDSECVFGFTAEEMYNLALRFGNYSKEELLTLTGGKELDVQAITADSTNPTLDKISAYYMQSEKCELGIEQIINFNDKEIAEIHKFEKLFREYHVLDKDETEKFAEEKMVEIKEELVKLAYSQDKDLETVKSYILRTFERAALNIAQTHNYKATIELDVMNTNKHIKDTIKVKTDLFDELTSRKLVSGFDETWDPELFLENVGVSSKKYNLLYGNDRQSIADESCGAQRQRLVDANTYILVTKTMQSNINNDEMSEYKELTTEYDKLTYGTYDQDVINNMIDQKLIDEGKYPKNTDYFSYIQITEKQIEYMDTHGVTRGKPGDTFELTKEEAENLPSNVNKEPDHWVDDSGNQSTQEAEFEKAKEELEKKENIVDEKKAKKKAEEVEKLAQQAQDAAYEHFAAGNTDDLAEWANHKKEAVRNAYNLGKTNGMETYKNKQLIENTPTEGGEVTQDKEYKNAETSKKNKKPVESVDNTTKTTESETTTEAEVKEETISETTGEMFENPMLDDGFAPVVTELSDSELSQLISTFSASELSDLFAVEGVSEEDTQGYTK